MSVSTHLTLTASKLIITDDERTIIDDHIDNLKKKIDGWFTSSNVDEQFAFGSYTRKTLMPRKADPKSDVDYMIVFKDKTKAISTYLSWLKDFGENKYSTSERYRSFPTVVLELSKIKIELVPAIKDSYDKYKIPSSENNYNSWLYTEPNSFNSIVTSKNTSNNHLIRPLIRLMKYWNALNDYVYSSYELEGLIVNCSYFFDKTLWDFVRTFVNNLSTTYLTTGKADKVKKLQSLCNEAYRLDTNGYPNSAEAEIMKAFPVY